MKLTAISSIFQSALLVLLIGSSPPTCWAQEDSAEGSFKEAELFIEFNASAADAGIQVFLDGDNWRKLAISDPYDRTIFMVKGKKTLGYLGLTELFFESVEPEIGDLPLMEFLTIFPEGEYEFEGITNDGVKLESDAEFTHAIPCGPEVMPEEGTVLDPAGPVLIGWEEVEEVVDPMATDTAGEVICADPEDFGFDEFEIETYQVIVETDSGDLIVDLPGTARQLTVPEEMIEEGALYLFEVLAKEGSGNQTITEGFFCTAPLSELECEMLADAP